VAVDAEYVADEDVVAGCQQSQTSSGSLGSEDVSRINEVVAEQLEASKAMTATPEDGVSSTAEGGGPTRSLESGSGGLARMSTNRSSSFSWDGEKNKAFFYWSYVDVSYHVADTVAKRLSTSVQMDLAIESLLGYAELGFPWEIRHSVALRSLWGTCLSLAVVAVGFGSWQMHDPILHPDRWWECMIQCGLVWAFVNAAAITTTGSWFITAEDNALIVKPFLILGTVCSSSLFVLWMAFYTLWTLLLQLPYPMPWHGILSGVGAFAITVGMSLYIFPSHWRRESDFYHRVKWQVAFFFIVECLVVIYFGFMLLVAIMPRSWQWTIAPLMIVIRELGSRCSSYAARKAAGKSHSSVDLINQSIVLSIHGIFLAVCVGSLTELSTTLVLLFADFAFNLYLATKVVRLAGSNDVPRRTAQSQALLSMVLSETMELILPLAYLACFLIVYYGPSGHVVGNVRSNHWHYTAVVDPLHASFAILWLAALDLSSLVISQVVLWKTAKISCWRVFLLIWNEHGVVLAIHHVWMMEVLFCAVAIGCAFDVTFEFAWIYR